MDGRQIPFIKWLEGVQFALLDALDQVLVADNRTGYHEEVSLSTELVAVAVKKGLIGNNIKPAQDKYITKH
jgi:hypothetical protein